jgi:hypothetical protein
MNINKNTRTETEARKLWCPMARVLSMDGPEDHSVAAAANRWWFWSKETRKTTANKNPSSCRCIAFECALWQRADDERGYCGLGRRA